MYILKLTQELLNHYFLLMFLFSILSCVDSKYFEDFQKYFSILSKYREETREKKKKRKVVKLSIKL